MRAEPLSLRPQRPTADRGGGHPGPPRRATPVNGLQPAEAVLNDNVFVLKSKPQDADHGRIQIPKQPTMENMMELTGRGLRGGRW